MPTTTVQTQHDKNTKTAKALIALGCVRRSGSSFEVKMPVIRHQHPVTFTVIALAGEFVCDCFGFKNGGVCPHKTAAEILSAQASEIHYQSGEIDLHYEGYAEAA